MRLDIIYASDENYAMYTGVSMCSLFENNRSIEELFVHIIDNNITTDSKGKLERLAKKYSRKIHFHNAKAMFEDLSKKITMKNTQTITAYACCFMSELLDNSVDKILYMDGDSLICGDLSELCKIDMNGIFACGTLDIAAPIVREKIGFEQEQLYINSGFLYMSLDNIRKADLRSKIVKFIEEVIPTSMHNDQDVVNGVYVGHIKVLPLKYNVLTPLYEKSFGDVKKFYSLKCYYDEKEVLDAIVNPAFVHFTGSFSRRPWIEGCKHPMKKKWNEYKSLTEWCDVPDKKDTRKTKKKVLDWIFNNFSVETYSAITGSVSKIKRIIKKSK